jgi:RNA polymerase sigma factor (TIGR02999 family)
MPARDEKGGHPTASVIIRTVSEESGEITTLLGELQNGDRSVEARLLEMVRHELHVMARKCMAGERPDHTLQPTALVNEVYLRVLGDRIPPLKDRTHFFSIAATAMRRVLIDHARAAQSGKRGGGMQRTDLDEVFAFTDGRAEEMIQLDRALNGLAAMDERQSRIVEMRFFAGMNEEEIAEVLTLSVRTVRREWRLARAWLYRELSGGNAVGTSA